MSRPESARTARVPYSRLVAHFLRHLEATTSLPLGGRLSEAPRDPAAHARIPALHISEAVGNSQPHADRIAGGHPPRCALRASLDSPYRTPRDANRPPEPVMHCPLGSLRSPRSYARASRNALSGAASPEPLHGYPSAPLRSLTARLRAATPPLRARLGDGVMP